jgi:hypothetical protein
MIEFRGWHLFPGSSGFLPDSQARGAAQELRARIKPQQKGCIFKKPP